MVVKGLPCSEAYYDWANPLYQWTLPMKSLNISPTQCLEQGLSEIESD